MTTLEAKALRLAKQTGESHAVVSMDYEDGRREYVVTESYLDDPEYDAFCGRIITIVEPDGHFV